MKINNIRKNNNFLYTTIFTMLAVIISLIVMTGISQRAMASTYSATKDISGYTTFKIYPTAEGENSPNKRIAYCFDEKKALIRYQAVGYELLYQNATSEQLYLTNNKAYDNLDENGIDRKYLFNVVCNIMWLGAPYNKSLNDYGAQAENLEPYEGEGVLRQATQIALWNVTNNSGFNELVGVTGTALGHKIYDEAIASYDKNLPAENGVDMALDIFTTEATNNYGSLYQTLLSPRVVLPPSVDVTLTAKKLLDGAVPDSSHKFQFELYDADGNLIETIDNVKGDITFSPINYTGAGTYTYIIKEVDDGRDGIVFDSTEYTVTVTVGNEDVYNLEGNKYYSIGDGENYYISVTANTKDIQVYCVDCNAMSPGSSSSLTYTYKKLVNPDSATLADYIDYNRYGEDLSENLRKLFYYIETHNNELSAYKKKLLVYGATSDEYPSYDYELEEIFAAEIPEDYDLVLFIPEGYTRSDPDSIRRQTLMCGIGATVGSVEEIVFRNETEIVVVPTGVEVSLSVLKGILIVIGIAVVMAMVPWIISYRKRKSR